MRKPCWRAAGLRTLLGNRPSEPRNGPLLSGRRLLPALCLRLSDVQRLICDPGWRRSLQKPIAYAQLYLALATVVFLMGCSTLSSDMLDRAQVAEAKLSVCMAQQAYLPEIPPELVACTSKRMRASSTVDGKVISLLQSDKERRECSTAILAWYKEIKASNASLATVKPNG